MGRYLKKGFVKGFMYEWRLVRLLRERGYFAVRVPKSGRYPYSFDVIAIKSGRIFFIEVKMRSKPEDLRLDKGAVGGLLKVAEIAGATPLIALYSKSIGKWLVRDARDYDKETPKLYVYKVKNNWRFLEDILS